MNTQQNHQNVTQSFESFLALWGPLGHEANQLLHLLDRIVNQLQETGPLLNSTDQDENRAKKGFFDRTYWAFWNQLTQWRSICTLAELAYEIVGVPGAYQFAQADWQRWRSELNLYHKAFCMQCPKANATDGDCQGTSAGCNAQLGTARVEGERQIAKLLEVLTYVEEDHKVKAAFQEETLRVFRFFLKKLKSFIPCVYHPDWREIAAHSIVCATDSGSVASSHHSSVESSPEASTISVFSDGLNSME